MRATILCIAILFCYGISICSAQGKQKIQIKSARSLKGIKVNGEEARRLAGNVELQQGEMILRCDTAIFFAHIDMVDAYGHVHISQGDSLDIYGDSLHYNGETKLSELFRKVIILQDDARLETDRLTYDRANKKAWYVGGGTIYQGSMTLTSEIGYYYPEAKVAYFKDSVVMTGGDYNLKADTLEYHTERELSVFHGPTDIETGENTIYCESGWYDGQTDESSFGENTVMYNGGQILYSDSVYFNNVTGRGELYDQFEWIDTAMQIIMAGSEGVFRQKDSYMETTKEGLLTYILSGDSLFLVGDTLKSMKDSTTEIRELFAYHDVKIYKSNMQGLCDSLYFSFQDSTIRMYHEPILWSGVNQMTGDTISILLKNQEVSEMELYMNGFVISESSPEPPLYNQIQGRRVTGYFKDSELYKMLARGRGQCVYYGKDDSAAYIGLNKVVCSNMWIYVEERDVERITFLNKPDAELIPISQVDPSKYILEGFKWRGEERPASKAAILRKEEVLDSP